jgi:hypothetical protein
VLHRSLLGAFVRHGAGRSTRRLLARQLERSPRRTAALVRLRPAVQLRNRRKAGVTYRVPAALAGPRRLSYALRWLRAAVRSRSERTLAGRLAAELAAAAAGRGEAARRRQAVHRTALLNRGFVRLLRPR